METRSSSGDRVTRMALPNRTSMTVRPREFSGHGSWDDYYSHFERVSMINNWTNCKVDFLWVHLSGDALSHVEALPRMQTATYEALCEALRKRFGSERLDTVY